MIEYVCISTSAGAVYSVEPEGSDTRTALEAGKKSGLIGAINKMAEYGYQLLDGTALVMETSLAGAYVAVFMFREK